MAARVNTEVYRASHGKRPGGSGHWIIDVHYCNSRSMTRFTEEPDEEIIDSVFTDIDAIDATTLRFVSDPTFTYSECVSELRRIFRYDRNAEIIPQP